MTVWWSACEHAPQNGYIHLEATDGLLMFRNDNGEDNHDDDNDIYDNNNRDNNDQSHCSHISNTHQKPLVSKGSIHFRALSWGYFLKGGRDYSPSKCAPNELTLHTVSIYTHIHMKTPTHVFMNMLMCDIWYCLLYPFFLVAFCIQSIMALDPSRSFALILFE